MQTTKHYETKFGQSMGNFATVCGILNGMIGSQLLILPVVGIKSGYITTLIVSFVTGFINYYTAQLIVMHLGKQKDIRRAILVHFGYDRKYVKIFSFFIWLSFLPCCFVKFKVICLQIQGLMGYRFDLLAPMLSIILIIGIILIRKYHIAQQTISLGAVSIISYVIFMIWAFFSAPTGDKTVPALGYPFQHASILMSGYSIHSFLAQNIIKNPDRQSYHKIVMYSFIIGAVIYTYVSFGSFCTYVFDLALVNRVAMVSHPQTIYDYFRQGQWQVTVLQIIYLIHVITVFPNFLIVSKVQFLNLFDIQVNKEINPFEILYIAVFVGLSYLIYVLQISLVALIVIYGSFMCYNSVIVMPIAMHFRCVFYNRSSGIILDKQESTNIMLNQCECNNIYKSRFVLYFQTFFLLLVLITGFIFVVFALMALK